MLTKLYLRNCRLMDSDVADLANGLQHNGNKSLKELDLGSNYVGYYVGYLELGNPAHGSRHSWIWDPTMSATMGWIA